MFLWRLSIKMVERMEENGIICIMPVTAYFSEDDELPSAWSSTKRLPSNRLLGSLSDWFQSITPLSKRLLHVSDWVIASQSNRLLYTYYRFLSFISLIASLFISLLYLMMHSAIPSACNTRVNKDSEWLNTHATYIYYKIDYALIRNRITYNW